MGLTAFAIGLVLAQGSDEVELVRTFTKGERLTYEVTSSILSEQQFYPYTHFLPSEYGLSYRFTTNVLDVREDGFATVRYERPEIKELLGETADSPPKTNTERVNWRMEFTLSPINEITGMKDLSPPKPPARDKTALLARTIAPQDQEQDGPPPFIAGLIRELYGLAMFTGSLDSALDFSPKLPFEPVKPGATWKRTVSYQPQRLAGTTRQAVQRLDFTYTYVGLVQEAGRQVQRVTGAVTLDTNAAEFVNQLLDMKPAESGLSAINLKLDTTITFDLDPKTMRTLRAEAVSTGGFKVEVTQIEGRPVVEEKFKVKTSMRPVAAPR